MIRISGNMIVLIMNAIMFVLQLVTGQYLLVNQNGPVFIQIYWVELVFEPNKNGSSLILKMNVSVMLRNTIT